MNASTTHTHTHADTKTPIGSFIMGAKKPIINQNLAIGDKASTDCRQLLLAKKRLGTGYWVFRTGCCGPHRKLAKNNSHATVMLPVQLSKTHKSRRSQQSLWHREDLSTVRFKEPQQRRAQRSERGRGKLSTCHTN